MKGSAFRWSALASLAVHAAALGVVTAVVGAASDAPPPVPIELVVLPAPPPPAPVTPPRPIVPPAPRPVRAEHPHLEPPAPPPAMMPAVPRLPTPVSEAPPPRPLASSLLASPERHDPRPVEGGPASAGKLFTTGDLPVVPGSGTGADSGAAGGSGVGLSATGSGTGGTATAAAVGPPTTFARPLGGYQTKPRYPESARRQGIEGVALLRFEVLRTGRVGRITLAQSAGHADLDDAAMEAVKEWRFEPARRGPDPVAVWVTLPVRFELKMP